jgi:hypothetical protein
MKFSCFIFFCLGIISGCNSQEKKPDGIINEVQTDSKPPSSFNDTLTIDYTAAVFYAPDSAQLIKIKAITPPRVFDGSMHEYEFQFRNSKKVLVANWSQVKITDVSNFRFLRFVKNNGQLSLVDLNKKNDPYGLIVFNKVKEPQLVDMTNVDNELYYYFSK